MNGTNKTTIKNHSISLGKYSKACPIMGGDLAIAHELCGCVDDFQNSSYCVNKIGVVAVLLASMEQASGFFGLKNLFNFWKKKSVVDLNWVS
ncbi:hypothetical protein M0804_010171 [Polistes exclamans]|nr:hypothetical protein M0804_010171 [Polistes exclamans]